MQNLILILFAVCFSAGLYLIGAELLQIPTYKATKAIVGMVRKARKARNYDAVILEIAYKFSRYIYLDEYKRRKLNGLLKSVEIPLTAEVYITQAIVKGGLISLGAVPCLLIMPVFAPVFIISGIIICFRESTRAETMIRQRRAEIEWELPRFVATITQHLKASRDILAMLESYQKYAGKALKNELVITIADMRTGNYEGALTRLSARVASAMLTDVSRGLISVLRGDDGVAYFSMLSHDMKQIELQRLKKLALERPPRIRRYSFLLLGCMVLLYMGVMGYQILGTMSGLF